MNETTQTNSIIGFALTSPVWGSVLNNINEILTVILTTLGIVLTAVKLTQALTNKDQKGD
ncbi:MULTISPECIES: hypothetical protein [unclassified Aminobacter]|uniref:hypothetical protein n=1 Tax=unclassified Aminobacter TaxID=2644704 RepID=UPI0004645DD6|nr:MULTISPECIES: hypothetical protein [unclassified Aminobacter]TWH35602.1 hypothetical protein L611_001200000830 [Aminobacter sp. J15]